MNICWSVTLLSLLCIFQLKAQYPEEKTLVELDAYFEEMYGPDQSLINGIHYYNLYLNCSGHQFFGENKFRRGNLVIENRDFHDVLIKYNLYTQQIILSHINSKQIYQEIIISNSRIQEFELDGKVFRKCYFPGTDTLFFQILEEGDIAFYFHWTIILIPIALEEYSQGKFSGMDRESYLLWHSKLYELKGARSFSRIFPEYQSQILKYIRKNGIKIKQATDADMKNLLRQCNIILQS
jgi:hypothetical protein